MMGMRTSFQRLVFGGRCSSGWTVHQQEEMEGGEEGEKKRAMARARGKTHNVAFNPGHSRRCIRGVAYTCHMFGMLQVSSSTESRADRRYRQDSSNTPASMITVGDSCHTQAPLASLANVRILYATQNHVMCVSYCRYAAQFRSARRRPVA